jgi:hypothetical protein
MEGFGGRRGRKEDVVSLILEMVLWTEVAI